MTTTLPQGRTYSAFRRELEAGQITVEQELRFFLERIERLSSLNAVVETYAEEALARARAIDVRRSTGSVGKLAGMVIGIKDNLCYAGHEMNAASKILNGFHSQFTGTALQRLLNEDAIFIGRLNCDQFAMGSSNETSIHGPVLNPLDPARVPGGSSGGSAAAVAASLCHVALGTDTGGSVRQPASFCGIVGLRPTYSRVSRHGLIAFASSMDQAGPLSHNVEDTARVMEVMAGADEYDATVSRRPVEEYSRLEMPAKPARIGVLRQCVEAEGLDPELRQGFHQLAEDLQHAGHTVEMVDFHYLDQMIPVYQVLSTAEASSNLGRYTGMTFGYRSPEAKTPEEAISMSRSEGFGPEVKRRIMLGTFVLSEGYFDAYYTRAMQLRRLVRDCTLDMFKKYDYLMLPTSPGIAFEAGAHSGDPLKMYLEDLFTIQSVLAGNPSISLPIFTHSSGMPMGLQLMAAPFAEAPLMAFSEWLMKNFRKESP